MQKIKRILIAALAAFTLLLPVGCLMLTGCRGITPQSLQSKARGIAYIVSAETLMQHPDWAPHLEVASTQFRTLSTLTNVDLPLITMIVSRLPVKELKGQRASIVITAGMLFLQDDVGEVAVNQPEELRRVALGAHEGIDLALRLSR